MDKKKYSIERINPKKYDDLIPIFKSAFNLSIGIKSITKKQNTDFVNKKDIGYIAYSDKNEPSGYYAVYPVNLSINSEIILSAQSGDTMVHKSHQRLYYLSKARFSGFRESIKPVCLAERPF